VIYRNIPKWSIYDGISKSYSVDRFMKRCLETGETLGPDAKRFNNSIIAIDFGYINEE
jgi:hypothetical protein